VVAVLRPGVNAMLKEGYVRRNHKRGGAEAGVKVKQERR
jgi:hypothetical protein